MTTSGITFVVLASLPKADLSQVHQAEYVWPEAVEKEPFLKALAKLGEHYQPRITNQFESDVDTKAGIEVLTWGSSDGGNGGGGGYSGGGKPKYVLANSGLAIWRFPTVPDVTAVPEEERRAAKFPPLVRFELAIHFSSHSHLTTYLDEADYGVVLKTIFDRVQVISVHSAVAVVGQQP